MAIQWGAYEYSSGLGIRVGIDVDWDPVVHGDATVDATVKIYTQNDGGSYDDSQTLNYGGSIGGSTNFTNNDAGAAVLRATKTYTYTYGVSSYGSTPGNKTFTAALSGAFNGVTPSKSVTSAIPARPFGAPAAPTDAAASRLSDTSTKISWTNNRTIAEPWDNIRIEKSINGGAYSLILDTVASAATSYAWDSLADNKYQFRVRAENAIGNSAYDTTLTIYTTPSTPTGCTRTGTNGTNQDIAWSNNSPGYTEYSTEIWRSINSAAYTLVHTSPTGDVGWTDTYPAAHPTDRFKYKVRHRTTAGTQGILYSVFSGVTTETTGSTSAPNAPTHLAPDNSATINPAVINALSWVHNPTDGTAQTKFEPQWKVQGAGAWTAVAEVTSAVQSWSPAANTFTDNSIIEWQVRTKGADATASAWSATATFTTAGDPNTRKAKRRATTLDLDTGKQEIGPVGALAPVGAVTMFGGASAPPGWLLCQGQSLLRADYPDLFLVIGTVYGSVDGTHFTLPNLQDNFPIGKSGTKALGTTGGAATKTIAAANLPTHTHTTPAHDHGGTATATTHQHTLDMSNTAGTNSAQVVRGNGTINSSSNAAVQVSGSHSHPIPNQAAGVTGNGGFANTAMDVMNPWLAINFIIKVT